MSERREINNNKHSSSQNLRTINRRAHRRNDYPVHMNILLEQLRDAERRRSALYPNRHVEATSLHDTQEEDMLTPNNGNGIATEEDAANSHNSTNENLQELNEDNVAEAGEEEGTTPVDIDSTDSDEEVPIFGVRVEDVNSKKKLRAAYANAEKMSRNRAELQAINTIQTFQMLLHSGDPLALAAQYDRNHYLYRQTMHSIFPIYVFHPQLIRTCKADRLKRLEEIARLKFLKQHCPLAKATEADTTESCVVCLLPFKEKQYLRLLGCKHKFHKKCLDEWSVTSKTCPVCRASFDGTPVTESVTPTAHRSDMMRSLDFILEYLISERGKRHSQATNSQSTAGTSSN